MSKLYAFLPLLFAGCAWFEPSFTTPTTEVPAALGSESLFVSPTIAGSWQMAETKAAEPRGTWWEMYDDAQLNSLITEALAHNPNLQVMAARVAASRAQAGLAESDLYPHLTADGNITRSRSAPAQRGLADTASSAQTQAQTLYHAGLGASYEVDLFGRIRGDSRAAGFNVLAAQDLYESSKLALQADVARAYFTLRTTTGMADAISETLILGERKLAIVRKQLAVGDIADADYQRAVADLMTIRTNALTIQQSNVQARNQLTALLGHAPASLAISSSVPVAALPPLIPADVSSSILQRRPDIAAAIHQLQAANADIGAARAAFFPRINLTANGGYTAREVSNLFSWNTATWAFGPTVTLPFFDIPALRSNLRLHWAVYEGAVATYQGQVVNAFREVDDALTAHRLTLEQASGQQQALAAMETAARAAERQYAVGDIALTDTLTARQSMLLARLNALQAQQNAYTASTQLIRALGGGWR